jgi:hypothetical protein
LPPAADEVCLFYLELVHRILPGRLKGLYVYGSAVLNDFRISKSDADFISVMDSKPEGETIEKLQLIHSMVQLKYKKPNMNGIYVTSDQLGKSKKEIKPITYYYEGTIYDNGYFEINYVTWYLLKYCSFTVWGTPADELKLNVNMDELLDEMKENMRTYWRNWIDKALNPLRISYYAAFAAQRIEWGVLGITRQYYTFHEKKITSKSDAGLWAVNIVPEKYHWILSEAVNIRNGEKSLYSSLFKRKHEAISYMNYIFNECRNRKFI